MTHRSIFSPKGIFDKIFALHVYSYGLAIFGKTFNAIKITALTKIKNRWRSFTMMQIPNQCRILWPQNECITL